MRGTVITVVAAGLIALAVVFSLRTEERFAVEEPRVEPGAEGARVVGTLVNHGDAAPRVLVEITVVGEDGRAREKESLELRDVGAGAHLAFSSKAYADPIRTYSIYVNEGRNPYGN